MRAVKRIPGCRKNARIGLGDAMLMEDGARIMDVAHASGYENPTAFRGRAFRRFTGLHRQNTDNVT
jgi:AraC-like DNA-binding protein